MKNKFRCVFYNTVKEVHYFYELPNNKGCIFACTDLENNRGHFLPKESRLQCTGLKDKNGVFIYEGDILVTDKNGRKGFVTYYTNYALFLVQYEHSAQFFNLLPDRQYFEVIGNIYENKNLLETQKGQ